MLPSHFLVDDVGSIWSAGGVGAAQLTESRSVAGGSRRSGDLVGESGAGGTQLHARTGAVGDATDADRYRRGGCGSGVGHPYLLNNTQGNNEQIHLGFRFLSFNDHMELMREKARLPSSCLLSRATTRPHFVTTAPRG